LQIDNRSVMVR